MKKFITVLMMAGVLCLTACGSKEKVIEGDTQGSGGQSQEAGDAQGQSSASTSKGGYTFTYKGTTIAMDVDAAPILEKLGEPASYYEAASCAFEGLDKMYTFSGFEVDTYPTDDKDFVSSVILKDDSVSTEEGVCIGDPSKKVLEAYGEASKDGDRLMEYEKDGMKLCFILQDDAVASIEYRSNVLN